MVDDWIVPEQMKPPAPATGADDWVTTPLDHPEAEKPTLASRAAEPLTSYPETFAKHRNASANLVNEAYEEVEHPSEERPWYTKAARAPLNLGKVLAGSLGYVMSPISAALETTVGKPVENVTGSPIAGKVAETAAGLAVPGYGLTRVPMRTVPSVPPAVTQAVDTARNALAKQNLDKAREFTDVHGRPMELSWGEAAQDPHAYAFEDQATAGAWGKPAQEAALPIQNERFDVMHGAGEKIGQELGGARADVTHPEHAAAVIDAEMREHAQRIEQARRGFTENAARAEQAQRGMVEDQRRSLEDIIRGGGQEVGGARDAGELVGEGVRSRAAAARTGVNQAYERAFELPGEIHAGAFEGVGTRIKGDLTFHDNPVIIDDVTTPVASRAIQHLDKSIDQLRIQNRADPMGQPNQENITAVNLRGVDQLRKQLNKFYAASRSGNNPSDARAMGRIIDAFDNQVESAVAGNLFSGDPRALQALRDARGAYRNYVQTFRPQGAGDDVGQAMRRIIDRGATPEEVSRLIVGSGAIGNAGLPVRLAQRLEQVFGRQSQEWSAIRQSMWQQANSGANAEKIAANIERFANSTLGRQAFTPQELAAMRNHAQSVRNLERDIALIPERHQAERVNQGYQQVFSGRDIGGTQGQTFRRIVEGTAQPNEIINTVFRAIGSGTSGNAARLIDTIGSIAGRESPAFMALRQGVWQTLTQRAAGMDRLGAQKLSQDVFKFIGGPIAKKLYSPEELAMMRKYAEVVRLKSPQAGSRSKTNPSQSAVSIANMLRRGAKWAPLLTHPTIGQVPVIGHPIAHGINRWLEGLADASGEAAHAANVKRSLQGLPPERASGGRAMADGGAPDDLPPDLPVMVDPIARQRKVAVVGENPAIQQGVKDFARGTPESFEPLGRVMTGRSENLPQDVLMGAAAVLPGPRLAKAGAKGVEAVAAPAITGAARDLVPGTKEFAKAATQAKAEIAAAGKGAGPLDLSSTSGIPETPQVALPRYEPPRGISPRLQEALQNPEVAKGVEESVKHGVETYGAEKWYHTEPIRRAFVDELGDEQGMKAFDQYMHLVAATSPRSDASTNARNASFYYGLMQRGEPIPAQNPQPYGHVAQNLHKDLAQNIIDAYKAHDLGAAARPDPWDLMKNPKPASFVENLRGNLVPGTMDTHAFRNIGMRTGDPRFLMSSFTEKFKGEPGPESMVGRFGEVNKPGTVTFRPQQLVKQGRLSVEEALKIPSFWESKPNPNEYAAAEQLYAKIGQKMGMPTADTQAAAWAGAGKLTGLETPPTHTFPELFNERVLFTSKMRNEAPQTTLRRFIRGEAPLLSVGGVLAISNGDWSRVGEEGVKPKRASGGRVPLRTRRESNYSPTRGHPDHHCGPDRKWPKGFCAKFRGPHSCMEVGGFIAARGHCDWYESAPEGRASGGRVLGHYVDLKPTEAQKAAGNYRKAHITMHGLGIAIENPKGSERSGVGKDGKAWSVRLPAHYGYIKGFIGRDKDHVDVYVGPYAKSKRAWVLHQHDEKSGRFDEHKVFLGFGSEAHVRKTYEDAFSDGRAKERIGAVHEMSIEDLKRWLHSLRYHRAA